MHAKCNYSVVAPSLVSGKKRTSIVERAGDKLYITNKTTSVLKESMPSSSKAFKRRMAYGVAIRISS